MWTLLEARNTFNKDDKVSLQRYSLSRHRLSSVHSTKGKGTRYLTSEVPLLS